ncbi:UbiA family prenyltransferase, partial [Spirochaetota bacterium]
MSIKSFLYTIAHESIIGKRGFVKIASIWFPLALIIYSIDIQNNRNLLLLSISTVVAVLCWAMSCVLINNVTDRKTDLHAGKKRWTSIISGKKGTIIALILLFVGSVSLVVSKGSAYALIPYFIAAAAGYLYSIPPIRFKGRGIAGIAAYSTSSACAYALVPGLLLQGESVLMGVLFIAVFSDKWINLHFHQIIDRNNDLAAGDRTYAAGVGISQARRSLSIAANASLLFLVLV